MLNRPSKWVLITGGSKGIGRATAKLLAQKGFATVLVARELKALQQTVDEISADGGTAFYVQTDLTLPDDVQHLLNELTEKNIRLDALILNAGVAKVGTVLSMPLQEWRHIFDVNVLSQVAVLQKLFPLLRSPASIVFVNSVAGKTAFANWGAYSASKFALRALADALRAEVSEKGIRIISIFPSSTNTSLHDNLNLDWPRQKMLRPQAVATAVWNALSADADTLFKEITIESTAGLF